MRTIGSEAQKDIADNPAIPHRSDAVIESEAEEAYQRIVSAAESEDLVAYERASLVYDCLLLERVWSNPPQTPATKTS